MRNFFIRHIYNPLLRRGYSKSFALFTVFFVSAVCHEYLVFFSEKSYSFSLKGECFIGCFIFLGVCCYAGPSAFYNVSELV